MDDRAAMDDGDVNDPLRHWCALCDTGNRRYAQRVVEKNSSIQDAVFNMIIRLVGAALACLCFSVSPGAAEPFRIAHNQNLPPLYMVQDGK